MLLYASAGEKTGENHRGACAIESRLPHSLLVEHFLFFPRYCSGLPSTLLTPPLHCGAPALLLGPPGAVPNLRWPFSLFFLFWSQTAPTATVFITTFLAGLLPHPPVTTCPGMRNRLPAPRWFQSSDHPSWPAPPQPRGSLSLFRCSKNRKNIFKSHLLQIAQQKTFANRMTCAAYLPRTALRCSTSCS